MSIPTSTSVVESAVIKAPLSQVWHHIKLQNFSNFWSALTSSEFVKGTNDEADVVHWTFKDGTELDVKQEEHSVRHTPYAIRHPPLPITWKLTKSQTINHYITYSIITAKPNLTYSSVLSTIRCYAVTSGELEGSTYIQWSGNFSSDADAGVIEDAKFKRRDALADLAKVATKN
ncbi:hypothetical protein E0Z10_g10734 [Xylaria hypoxylon]|uniref:Bet v1-like protein n=1 Tax=Xylaria hypoxylon TaxID=37992 RepID=A0A4Z0YCI7_9PEZI|nr:hypothetical protein E0Z10_g10734 [Xylaria hypoxylon]